MLITIAKRATTIHARVALVFASWLALSACRASRAAPGDTTRAEASAGSPAQRASFRPDDARRLALADPRGSARVDAELRAYQDRARKLAENADSWILLGRAWIRKARETSDSALYLNARACADIVLERQPKHRLAQSLIGQALLNDHEFHEARALAQRVLHDDPEDLDALAILADAALELGRYDEATSAVEKMNDLKPGLPAYSRASYLQWLRGEIPQAKESIRLAIESGNDPNDPEPRCWALVQAALIFFNEGDYDGADAGFQKALASCSDYAPALVGRGRVALARGGPKRAAELFAKAHAKSPLADTAWRLGDARSAAGDAKGAETAYADVLAHASDRRTLSAFLSTKNRDANEAIRLAQAEMKDRPGIYTADALAWALLRAGKTAEADAAMKQALRLGTPDALLLHHAGAIKIARGELAAGRKLIERALELSPHFELAPEARELLSRSPVATVAH
jgi:tetratricopeptide (TPR) repeat protein